MTGWYVYSGGVADACCNQWHGLSSHNPLGSCLNHLHVKATLFRTLQHLPAYFAFSHNLLQVKSSPHDIEMGQNQSQKQIILLFLEFRTNIFGRTFQSVQDRPIKFKSLFQICPALSAPIYQFKSLHFWWEPCNNYKWVKCGRSAPAQPVEPMAECMTKL